MKKNKIISSKSERVIRKNLSELRRISESSNDIIEKRVAQCLETGIIWATQETVDWPEMWEEAVGMTNIIEEEIAEKICNSLSKIFENE